MKELKNAEIDRGYKLVNDYKVKCPYCGILHNLNRHDTDKPFTLCHRCDKPIGLLWEHVGILPRIHVIEESKAREYLSEAELYTLTMLVEKVERNTQEEKAEKIRQKIANIYQKLDVDKTFQCLECGTKLLALQLEPLLALYCEDCGRHFTLKGGVLSDM